MLSTVARRIARHPAGTHPALWSFAEECRGLCARLLAYMGVVALIAIGVSELWDQLPTRATAEPEAKVPWSVAERSHPAFAVSQADSAAKIETYEISRHPDGGRKDVLRWAVSAAEKPVAELELYRPGAEAGQAGPLADQIAARMDPDDTREIVGQGIIESKFGPVTLLGFADRESDVRRCLGFMKNFEAANLRISGWSCQGETLPARRAAIACTLNRLTLLTAGNDPKLAELFAHAELRRADCAYGNAAAALSADWVTGAQNPRLRGSL
jgi:hypothetical protein